MIKLLVYVCTLQNISLNYKYLYGVGIDCLLMLHLLQVLLFSATFNEKVTNFVSKVIKGGGNQLFVKKEELSLEAVKQYKVYCPDELAKIDVIKSKIFELGEKLGQRIIFVRTKNSARMLHQQLVQDGYAVTTIQGALNAEDRDKIVKEFKDGLTQVLISTDLLARGFDQQQVPFTFPLFLTTTPCPPQNALQELHGDLIPFL